MNPFNAPKPVSTTSNVGLLASPTATTPNFSALHMSNPFNATQTTPSTPFANTGLGIGVNTVLGLPQAAAQVGTDLFHSITSSIASIVPSVGEDFGGPSQINVPQGGLSKGIFNVLFGDKPITSLQTQVAQGEQAIKQSPFAQKIGLDKFALPLAFGGVVGNEALNFIPVGGEAKIVTKLAAESDPAVISHTLEQIGVHSDLIPTFATQLAEAGTTKEVKDIFNVLKSTQGLKQIDSNAADHLAAVSSIHPEDLSLLKGFASQVNAKGAVPLKPWEQVKDVMSHYGLMAPDANLSQKEAAKYIQNIAANAETRAAGAADGAFNASLDKQAIQPATVNPSRVALPQPQPRQANGWWDSFKSAISDQRGMIRNPLAGGEDLPKEVPTSESLPYDNTVEHLKRNLNTSGGDWELAIKSGDIPKEQIYRPDGAFTPAATDHVVSDLAGKMNMYEKGLGDEFKKTVDLSNPTRESLVGQAQEFIASAKEGTQTAPEIASKLPSAGGLPERTPIGSKPEVSSAPLDTKNFKYVKNEPLDIKPLKNDRTTAVDIRQEYAGVKNSQIARGNQLADELRRMAPKEQEGMFWYKAAKGDTATLEGLLKDPKFDPYQAGIKSALNLSPEAKAALAKGNQYYKEAGTVSKEVGTIGTIRDEYQNRIYAPEPEKDFVKTEIGQGLKQSTSHAKQRVFDSEIDAVKAGKTFATTKYADALAIHNEEMARVNTARALMDTMEKRGLGAWVSADERPAAGWTQVGQLRNGAQSFYAPKGIAKGLTAIVDPDFMRRVDTIRTIQKYQGFVKSVDLSFSFFHHLTFVTQTLSSKKGLTTLAQMVTGGLKMDAPEFLAMEQDFIRHDGMTTQVAATQDIMKELSKGDDNISKLLQLPVGKQINKAIEASNGFLFNKMQRFMKVMTYQKNAANWIASHPNATNEEVVAAKRGFSKAINAEFGGLNWQAMGVTKSNQSILRTLFLAPDWLTSAGAQMKYAVSDTGTAGNVARMTLVKAIVGGMTITEGINKLMTGHFTDQNPKGHKMEIEVAPNVYVSLIRGAPGELLKFLSNAIESGPIQGPARYLQGKLSPIARTALEFASGVDYSGRSIYQGGKHPTVLSKTFGGLMSLLTNISPVPFSFTSLSSLASSGKMTPLGTAAAATGVGRVSLPSKKKSTASNPFNQ